MSLEAVGYSASTTTCSSGKAATAAPKVANEQVDHHHATPSHSHTGSAIIPVQECRMPDVRSCQMMPDDSTGIKEQADQSHIQPSTNSSRTAVIQPYARERCCLQVSVAEVQWVIPIVVHVRQLKTVD
jgi:hypothetical protein